MVCGWSGLFFDKDRALYHGNLKDFLTRNGADQLFFPQTPEHGLNFEASTSIKAVPDREKEAGVQPLGWYRTLIQFDRAVEYLWPEQAQGGHILFINSFS
jgi:hypothetical protein